MLLLQKKSQLGNMFKKQIFTIFILFFSLIFAPVACAYQTALITYPEYNKNWKQVYFGKQDSEVISQWIPSYENHQNWTESVVFHAYNWAKGQNCYKFMSNLLAQAESRNPTFQSQIIKDKPEDSVAIWCTQKTNYSPAQCEILRVTAAYEGIVSMHYVNKNTEIFKRYQVEPWLKIIRDVRIYYSYFRWDRVTGKATSVQLQ